MSGKIREGARAWSREAGPEQLVGSAEAGHPRRMRLTGKAAQLFAAFSDLSRRAGDGDTLLSCLSLSKVPSYGDVLRRFAADAPPRQLPGIPVLLARHLLVNAAHLGCLILGRLALAVANSGGLPRGGEGKPILLIDTFLLADRCLEAGEYREAYLPGLADAARENKQTPVMLFRLHGTRNPLRLFRLFRILDESGADWITDLHLLRPADWLALVRHLFVYPLAHLRLLRLLADAPEHSAERHIREALLTTFPLCHMVGETRRLAARRLPGRLPPGARMVSWFENQVADKALYRGLRQAEAEGAARLPVIGAQLYIWPSTLINYHLDPVDAERELVPDSMLVCGPYFVPENPLIPYAVGPSLRYAALFPDADEASGADSGTPRPMAAGGIDVTNMVTDGVCGRQGAGGAGSDFIPEPAAGGEGRFSAGAGPGGYPNVTAGHGNDWADRFQSGCADAGKDGSRPEPEDRPLLVLLSYHRSEIERSLALVREWALAGRPVVYRFHPAVKPADYASLLPPDPVVDLDRLKESVCRARAVLGHGSGALVEAAVWGAPVLVLSQQGRLPGIEELLPPGDKGRTWDEIAGAEELEAALAGLEAAAEPGDRMQRARRLRQDLFTRPDRHAIRRAFFA